MTGGLAFVKSLDPVVVFWGLDYTHQFERDGLGQRVQPGETFGYNLGLGFAVNEDVSLSAQVGGAYQTETRLGGIVADGTSREPVTLRLGLTNRWSSNTYLEPSVTFGLNDDAADVGLGLSITRRFGGR
jgi:hypothetical protein